MTEKNVHTEHCCVRHGCKYGEDDTCPVTTKQQSQSYPCEDCDTSIMTEFKWGDLVEALDDVSFSDGTKHVKGQQFVVRAIEVAYFNHPQNNVYYSLVERPQEGVDYPYENDYN